MPDASVVVFDGVNQGSELFQEHHHGGILGQTVHVICIMGIADGPVYFSLPVKTQHHSADRLDEPLAVTNNLAIKVLSR